MVGIILGNIPAVIVNDPKLVKEMLFRHEFDGRMDIILGRLRAYWKQLGIFFTDGYFWYIQRRFSLRYLRDFGFGRRDDALEAVLASEIKEIIDMRTTGPLYAHEKDVLKGDLVKMPCYLSTPFMNGMLSVLAKVTLPREEFDTLWDLMRGGIMFNRNTNDLGCALTLTPSLKYWFPNLSGFNALYKGNNYFTTFFRKLVNDTLATYDESHDRHFLDMYITKMRQESKELGRTTFSDEQLQLICTDYMFPSSVAPATVLAMLVERLLLQPETQEKVHEELDRVVGRNRLPNLDDRKNMPYTEGCIREAFRMESIVPLGLPHRALSDTEFDGYSIPEGSLVAANYIPLHMGKDIWGDPENFRPERYIVNGKLDVSLDKSLPFGAGRRLCAGETYTRQTMFLVLATLMHTFTFTTPDGQQLKKPFKRIPGLVTTIDDYWVKLVPRV